MRPYYLLIVLLFSACVLLSCNNNSDDSNDFPVTQVTFADNGVVFPDAISTTVTISSDSIEYSASHSQSGTVTEQWSELIQSSDFESLLLIIDDYDLLQMNDITLEEGQAPCDGWAGMTITIDYNDSYHSFDITGDVCPREQWPEGVRELVDLKDKLVNKYL